MAHAKFPAEVLTPEGEVFSEEMEMLSTKHGGRLDRHPCQSRAAAGDRSNRPSCACIAPRTEIVRFAQAEGYLQFADNRALVLVEEAVAPEQLDRSALEAKLADARTAAERAAHGSEEQARALRDVRRHEAFLATGQ